MDGHGQPALLYLVPCTLGNELITILNLGTFIRFLIQYLHNVTFLGALDIQGLLLFWVGLEES